VPAGILAVWSVRIEPTRPGPLAEASRVLARFAQTKPRRPRPRRTEPIWRLRGVAMVIYAASNKGKGPRGQLVLLRQIIRMMDAIAEASRARGDAMQAVRRAEGVADRVIR
jgi:hypothetical protein